METITTASMSDERHFSITETVQQFGKRLFGFVRGKVKLQKKLKIFYKMFGISLAD